MEGAYDPKKAFEQYQKEHEGEPINPLAAEAGKKELEFGEKIGYATYGEEPERAAKFKNDPEGHLYKTDLTPAELEEEISDLTTSRQALVSFLEDPDIEDLEITRETNLFDLEEKLKGADSALGKAVSDLAKYDFEGDIALFELPQEIEERVRKDRALLDHLQRKLPES